MQLNSLWLYYILVKTLTGTLDEKHDLNAESDRVSKIHWIWILQLVTLFFSVFCSYFKGYVHTYLSKNDHNNQRNSESTEPLNTGNFFKSFWLEEKFFSKKSNAFSSCLVFLGHLLCYFTQLCILAFVNYALLEAIKEQLEKNKNKFEPNIKALIAYFTLFTFVLSIVATFTLFCIFQSIDRIAYRISFFLYHFCCYFTLTCILMTVTPSKLFLYSTIIGFPWFALPILNIVRSFGENLFGSIPKSNKRNR